MKKMVTVKCAYLNVILALMRYPVINAYEIELAQSVNVKRVILNI